MPEQSNASIIRLSAGHTLHVKEAVEELGKRIAAARRDGPLGIVAVSENASNDVLLLVGHLISVSPR